MTLNVMLMTQVKSMVGKPGEVSLRKAVIVTLCLNLCSVVPVKDFTVTEYELRAIFSYPQPFMKQFNKIFFHEKSGNKTKNTSTPEASLRQILYLPNYIDLTALVTLQIQINNTKYNLLLNYDIISLRIY